MSKATIVVSLGLLMMGLGVRQSSGFSGAAAKSKKGFTPVAAIFNSNCMPCHSAQKRAGDYDLSSFAGALKGGHVVPGKPSQSALINYIKGGKKPAMPMGRPPLSKAKIKVIEDWIKAGAKK